MGRFNSGGTSTEDGLILGVEKMENLDGLVPLVAHELIHFQQKLPGRDITLLEASLMEGSADFIGELISGINLNQVPFVYGERHAGELCREFVKIMHRTEYQDWLYSTSGKDKRPNDLGYWMGYKIAEAYFNQATDKQQAIQDLLTLGNAQKILNQGGYLKKYPLN